MGKLGLVSREAVHQKSQEATDIFRTGLHRVIILINQPPRIPNSSVSQKPSLGDISLNESDIIDFLSRLTFFHREREMDCF